MALGFVFTGEAAAHPLGNFTINHFARIKVGTTRPRPLRRGHAIVRLFRRCRRLTQNGTGTLDRIIDGYRFAHAAPYAGAILLDV